MNHGTWTGTRESAVRFPVAFSDKSGCNPQSFPDSIRHLGELHGFKAVGHEPRAEQPDQVGIGNAVTAGSPRPASAEQQQTRRRPRPGGDRSTVRMPPRCDPRLFLHEGSDGLQRSMLGSDTAGHVASRVALRRVTCARHAARDPPIAAPPREPDDFRRGIPGRPLRHRGEEPGARASEAFTPRRESVDLDRRSPERRRVRGCRLRRAILDVDAMCGFTPSCSIASWSRQGRIGTGGAVRG